MSKRALGKGIEALLQLDEEDSGSQEKAAGLVKVSLDKIQANPNQPRKSFDDATLQELADSIREQGLIQPVLVERTGDHFTLVAGERRYRAAKLAELEEIPVIIRSFTEAEKLEIALIENIQREDLNPIEEAAAYKQIMESASLSQEEVAKKVGKQRSTIANSLRLLKLPQDMQKALVEGRLTSGHARAILSVVNPSDQRILFSRIVNDFLSVREAELQATNLNKGIRSEKTKSDQEEVRKKDPDVQSIEQRFIDRLGTKVSIKGSLKKGKIEISYFSMDDLERMMEIIGTD